jgi:iron-sulfur cluster assembly accessory protein
MIACRYLASLLFVSSGVLVLGCDNPATSGASGPDSPSAVTVSKPEPTTDDPPLVVVTPKAVESVSQIVKDQGVMGTWYLRVRLVPGGCCGFLHKLDLDGATMSLDDYTFQSGGIKLVVLKRQIEMIRGARIDFGREGDQEGFLIKNPNFEGESLKKWLPVLAAEKRAE